MVTFAHVGLARQRGSPLPAARLRRRHQPSTESGKCTAAHPGSVICSAKAPVYVRSLL